MHSITLATSCIAHLPVCNGYTNVSNYEKIVNLELILPSTLYTVAKINVLTDYDYDFNVPLVMSSEGLLAPTLL